MSWRDTLFVWRGTVRGSDWSGTWVGTDALDAFGFDEEEFAGMIDTGTEPDELVEAYVDEVAVEGDPFVLEASEVATEWRSFTDDGGDTAYVAEIGLDPATRDAAGEDATRTVMVYGSADPEVLQDLLASLTTAPLR